MWHVVVFLWLYVVRQVCCEDVPSPRDVQVDSVLTWSPDPRHTNGTYRVQYRRFSAPEWQDVQSCVSVTNTFCDITETLAASPDPKCVELRVHTHAHTRASRPASACSTTGGLCSPVVKLSACPGFLTVSLGPSPLSEDYGGHLQHLVYYGLEGETLQNTVTSTASVNIERLAKGRSYCVQVQFLLYSKPLGAPSCPRCVLVPFSGEETNYNQTVFILVLVIILVVVAIVLLYVCLFQGQKIKSWIKGQFTIPEFLIKSQPPLHPISWRPLKESYDTISLIVATKEFSQRASEPHLPWTPY